jgi:hypothetical protein
MTAYHRNINFRIILIWVTSILFALAAIYLAFSGYFLATLLLVGLAILTGFIRFHGLVISADSITVRRYFAYGFRKKEFIIPRKSYGGIELWEHGSLNHTVSTDTWLDLFFLPALFVSGKRGMTFKDKSAEPDKKFHRIYLSDNESKLIKEQIGLFLL